MAYIKGYDRNQGQMFPEYLDDYVDEDNPVRVIDAFVDYLDLEALQFTKMGENRPGAPSYYPGDLLKLYIYGYMNGIRTSRKLEKETYVNIEVMWLIKKLHPDFKTIADFRKENKKQLVEIFKQFNLLLRNWDLLGNSLVAIDGTKFRADNSKKKNYNQKKIERQLKYINDKTKEYLEALEKSDKEEETEIKYTPAELKEKLQTLKKREKFYKDLENQLIESGESEISTTDPESRLMDNKKNGLEVSYNVQTAVEEKNKLIIAMDVTNKPADQGHLNTMAQAAKETLGIEEKGELKVVADKGYYQAEDLKKCEKNGTITYVTHQTYSNATGNPEYYKEKFKYDAKEDIYICPMGQKLYRPKQGDKEPERIQYKNFKACKNCLNKEKCTKSKNGRIISRSKDQDFLDKVDARTRANMDKYLKRQTIVEHPFGTIKRSMNAGYFLTRGLDSVRAEAALVFLSYNMKRAINIIGVKNIVKELMAISAHFYVKIKLAMNFLSKQNKSIANLSF